MIKIYNYNEVNKKEILSREALEIDVTPQVKEIIDNVKKRGDEALFDYTYRFDNAKLESLLVTKEEIADALDKTDKEFIRILEKAKKRITNYHEKQKRNSFIISEENGVILGQKIVPLERVGIYVPGGSAQYPSTVLMDAIPAKIAGCKEIIMVTPPQKDGSIDSSILAACYIAGVDRIYKVGGAQAIAALAYGTETIKKVDKIVGPGNIFVATAKKMVSSTVSIDMVAGPSEILIIAEDNSSSRILASDLLSQAEHDKNATSVLLTTSLSLAKETQKEVERQLELLPRKDIARASIEKNGKIIVFKTLDEAIEISNLIAPEHLELFITDPFSKLDKVTNAGSVFLGKSTPEALGDYMAGPNHTLPTLGYARFSSPLSVDDYIKKYQFTYYTPSALEEDIDNIAYFARKEGLEGHARSVLSRRDDNE